MCRRCLGSFLVALGAVWLAGCTEPDTITNSIEAPGGAIYGRVSPAEAGTRVSAWQATEVKSTLVDAEGFFTIAELPPGLYTVVALSPSGLRREIPDVAVDRTRSVALGVITLMNVPSPFIAFFPADGDSDVSLNSLITISSAERIDRTSLSTAVDISPPVEGSWNEFFAGIDRYQYTLHVSSGRGFTASTTYVIRIGPELRFLSETTWDQEFAYEFHTARFSIQNTNFRTQRDDVHPLWSGSLVSISFNARLDDASARAAVRLQPEAPTDLFLNYDQRQMDVLILGGLAQNTRYLLLVDGGLQDTSGHTLGVTDTLDFWTQPFQVTSLSFPSSVAPGSDMNASMVFNSRVDVDALNSAASFDPPIAGLWIETFVREGSSNQGAFLEFFPTTSSQLVPEQEYVFTLDGSVPLSNGASLGDGLTAAFAVAPVSISSVDPRNALRSVHISSIVRVRFNTPMDHGSSETAFALETLDGRSVLGTITWSSDSRELQFRPDGQLLQDYTYRVVVSTAAQSVMGPTLKTAWSSVFRTRP